MPCGFFRLTGTYAAMFCGGALLFSFMAPWLPMADSVNQFRMHLIGALAILIPILLTLRVWRMAGVSVVIALIGLAGLAPAFPVKPYTPPLFFDAELKLVQINTYYRNKVPNKVVDFIRQEKPDIITMQEISARNRKIIDALALEYPTQLTCEYETVGSIAILSRLPRAPDDVGGCSEAAGLAVMRVMVGERVLSVATIHLHWPFPFEQKAQIDAMIPVLEDLTGPLVLAGDFNAVPWSHAVDRIAEAAQADVVPGLRITFKSHWRPLGVPIGLPIDQVLVSEDIETFAIDTAPSVASDHLPVILWFELK